MRLNIDNVAVAKSGEQSPAAGPPGSVLQTSPSLLIATADTPLEILELQPAGKRSMPAADFLRGQRVNIGDRFGREV
jgi:methionyl-tRNA formyltransferase